MIIPMAVIIANIPIKIVFIRLGGSQLLLIGELIEKKVQDEQYALVDLILAVKVEKRDGQKK